MRNITKVATLAFTVITMMTGCRSDNANDLDASGRAASLGAGARAQTVITASDAQAERPKRQGNARQIQSSSDPGAKTKSNETVTSGVTAFGKVVQYDGKPVAGAKVALHGMPNGIFFSLDTEELSHTITKADGTYEVATTTKEVFMISVKGDLPEIMVPLVEQRQSKVDNSSRRYERNISIPASLPLSGKVVNEKDEPVQGVVVHVQPEYKNWNEFLPAPVETTTTLSGDFTFPFVVPGFYMAGTASTGYAPGIQAFEAPTSVPLVLKLSQRGGTINGKIVHKSDGKPVSGMKILSVPESSKPITKLEMLSQFSGADGSFLFNNVSSGRRRLMLAQDEQNKLGLASPLPQSINLSEGETTDVLLFVYPGHTLSGTLFDKMTSEPIAGANVTVNGQQKREATTDGDGRYHIPSIFVDPGSELLVTASSDNHIIDTGEKGGTHLNVSVTEENLDVHCDIAMLRMVKVSGRVVTREEMPVSKGTVNYATDGGAAIAELTRSIKPDGTFEVLARPFSNGIVHATADGFAPGESVPQTLTTKDITGLKIVMDVGSTVQGKVIMPDGKPAVGASITRRIERNFGGQRGQSLQHAGVTDPSGNYVIKGLPAKVALSAKLDAFADSEYVEVTLTPGEIRNGVDLKLRPTFEISGRVVDSNMSPLLAASVQCSGHGIYKNAGTDRDGRFTVSGLPDGAYSVQVYGSHGDKLVEGIRAGTKDLEIILEKKKVYTLIGLVVDDITDEPVKDFKVDKEVKLLDEPGKFQIDDIGLQTWRTLRISSPLHEEQAFVLQPQTEPKKFVSTFRLGTGGVITGRVVERGTGTPVAGVTVVDWGGIPAWERSRSGHKGAATTDADGRFSIGPVPSGDNEVQFTPQAPYSELYKKAVVVSAETFDMGDVELSKGSTIRGKVLRGLNDDPVVVARVELTARIENNPLSKAANSDAEGNFEFTGLAPAQYTVAVQSATKQLRLDAEQTAEVLLRLGGTTIKGTVTRAGGGVNDVLIHAQGDGQAFKGDSNSQGEYEVADVIPGMYSFTVSHSGVTIKETLEIPDQPVFEKHFVFPDGRLQVSVIDSEGDPVPGASVAITQKSSDTGMDQKWQTQKSLTEATNSAGIANFQGLKGGSYSVQARKDGKGTALNPSVQVQGDGNQQVQLELSSQGGTLVSVAISYTTGKGVSEAWCYLFGPGGSFTHQAGRDAAGVMTIENIPPGSYTTNVSYWSHSQSERTVEIKAGETATIEDVLYPAGALQWTLKTADGKAAGGAAVTVEPIATTPEERPRSGQANGGGLYVERGLAPGTYQVTATLPGKTPYTETHSIGAGANTIKETVVPGW